MKAANTLGSIFSCLGNAGTGLFILAFGVHAAPRTVEQGTTRAKSSALQLVTGPAGSINEAIAAGATVEVTLQPVQPKTQPPSSYPAGSSIVDQTLTLSSVPARIWIEVLLTGWAENLNTAQVTISATDADMDGGGYSGTAADCNGESPVGAGDLQPARQPCGTCQGNTTIGCSADSDCTNAGTSGPCSSTSQTNGNVICRNAISGRTSNCNLGEPSRCSGLLPDRFCEPGFIDGCDPEFIGAGLAQISAVDLSIKDYRFGISESFDEVGLLDFNPSYLGTFVIDAPANARGTYTIDVDDFDTFLLNPNFPPGNQIPIALFKSAVIETACTLQADPSGISKTRFISFSVPPNMAGVAALRVKPLSLHHVDPPYTGAESTAFTEFEFGPNCAEAGGCVRWVGPPTQYTESTSDATAFYASSLQCTPHYQNWSTVGLLHVTGSAIVPSSVYEVEAVDQSCMGNETNCAVVTPAISFATTRWGDVMDEYNPPATTAQPDVADIAALVSKFRSTAGAPIKARALLAGSDAFGNINSLDVDLGFTHIAACVEAFRGRPYPHTISSCP
jgi:hypothetical protein